MLYLTAEELHVSGILAVVASGLFVRFDRTGIGPNVARTNIVSSSVWGVLSFSLNGAVFILLGMQLPKAMSASWDDPGVSNVRLSIVILLVSLVVVTMRFLWVAGMLRLARDVNTGKRRKMTPARWRSAAVMTFGGAKGTITLSLMFTIPFTVTWGVPFPMRDELIFIASGVIVVTLLLANFMLPLLAPNRDRMAPEMTEITIEILRKTVEELTGESTMRTAARCSWSSVVYEAHHEIEAARRGIRPPGIGAAADRGAALGEGLSQESARRIENAPAG